MRMIFRYEDGTEFVITERSESLCVYNADELTEEHGDIIFYSEIEKNSFLYENDGIQ